MRSVCIRWCEKLIAEIIGVWIVFFHGGCLRLVGNGGCKVVVGILCIGIRVLCLGWRSFRGGRFCRVFIGKVVGGGRRGRFCRGVGWIIGLKGRGSLLLGIGL